MHLTISSLVLGLVVMTASVDASPTDINLPSGAGTFIPPRKSKVLSVVRAAASSQVKQSAFAAEMSKIPQAKGHNIPSDIAIIANDALYSSTIDTAVLPSWFNAAPSTNTAIASAIVSDVQLGEKTRVEGATKVTTNIAAAVASATKDDAAPVGGAAATTGTKTSDTTTKTSTTGKTTSTTTTKSSNAGGASQSTNAIMAAGAAAAGVLGIAAML
ncbi:MAG: hypothetical protein Q9191_002625 [Dirinaria sp. TL-2023a]